MSDTAPSPAETEQMLRNFRTRLDLTQEEAAAYLGIPVPTYRNAEYGRGFPYPLLLELAVTAFLSGKPREPDA